ncbi:MAG: malto-oligosyltrehalose trehalohydrolase [Thermodesulfobacteriota bacterium]
MHTLGASSLGDGRTHFLVWAPRAERVDVHLVAPRERVLPLEKGARGYFAATLEGVEPGSRYFFRLDGHEEHPDPASRYQPQGVHGPSEVVDPHFAWSDDTWAGLPLRDYVIYEVHVGTYTPEGTLTALIPHLEALKDLGITALELMPVAQFPGGRNWGYDGTYPFAVQNTYGGPVALKELVNACHARGLAVILDVVYNHLGPEGNYLANFGPYFTGRYRTPWGKAVNFDGPGSDEVRRYFIDNARQWVADYHVDALRLDALHAIVDLTPRPFLADLADAIHFEGERLNRRLFLMAESDLNDVRLLKTRELGGVGLDAHWNDDYHHALHTLLTGEQTGYYLDFGRLDQLAKGWREGFIYTGEYAPYRRRRHGSSSRDIAAERFVVFAQNHDQVGNRLRGDRLSTLVSFEALKLAAGMVTLSPGLPLLFMGEEFGETAPFLYFVSHGDPDLIDAVRQGRKEEFAAFRWLGEPPDPQAEETFVRSRINHQLRQEGQHRTLWEFHRALLHLRRELAAWTDLGRKHREVLAFEEEKVLWVRMTGDCGEALLMGHFGDNPVNLPLSWPAGRWRKCLDSQDRRWQGPGSQFPEELHGGQDVALALAPQALVVYLRNDSIP